MFISFGVLKVELNNAADIIISFVDRQFDFIAFFGSVFEYFWFFFFVENDFDIDGPAKSTKEVGYFILSKRKELPYTGDKMWDYNW